MDDAPPSAPPPAPHWSEPLRARPVLVAACCVVVCGLLVWRIGLRPDLPAFLYLGVVGVALGVIDAAIQRLPDPLTLPSYGIVAALLGVAAFFTDDGGARFLHALIGMAALYAWFALQVMFLPVGAMYAGDAKLGGVLGLGLGWLGWQAWVLGLVATVFLAGIAGVVLLAARRAGRKSQFPYGPYMLLGSLIAILLHAS
ncbi:prepilin peptidase [Actinomadura barringtoniae]|uniref:Prepilin peptidase n=1 Tax=Actinomadura barringtoniae TaxID=1427535 RepID=A0A939PH25_9ACTN|nr:prepilin peptidase [Actinomadura barringtoniae]MBO2452360.1 prepilin peptidase [Actinomadura barringtoniae]